MMVMDDNAMKKTDVGLVVREYSLEQKRAPVDVGGWSNNRRALKAGIVRSSHIITRLVTDSLHQKKARASCRCHHSSAMVIGTTIELVI